MTNPNCRVLIFSILRFISTKCCKTQMGKMIKCTFTICNEGMLLQAERFTIK